MYWRERDGAYCVDDCQLVLLVFNSKSLMLKLSIEYVDKNSKSEEGPNGPTRSVRPAGGAGGVPLGFDRRRAVCKNFQ